MTTATTETEALFPPEEILQVAALADILATTAASLINLNPQLNQSHIELLSGSVTELIKLRVVPSAETGNQCPNESRRD